MKFHKNLSCGSRVIPCRTTDRQTQNTPNNEDTGALISS